MGLFNVINLDLDIDWFGSEDFKSTNPPSSKKKKKKKKKNCMLIGEISNPNLWIWMGSILKELDFDWIWAFLIHRIFI